MSLCELYFHHISILGFCGDILSTFKKAAWVPCRNNCVIILLMQTRQMVEQRKQCPPPAPLLTVAAHLVNFLFSLHVSLALPHHTHHLFHILGPTWTSHSVRAGVQRCQATQRPSIKDVFVFDYFPLGHASVHTRDWIDNISCNRERLGLGLHNLACTAVVSGDQRMFELQLSWPSSKEESRAQYSPLSHSAWLYNDLTIMSHT